MAYTKPRVDSAGLAALLAFLLGPLGILIVGFTRLAGVLFLASLGVFLLGFTAVLVSPVAGMVLIFITPLVLMVAYPWATWRAYRLYESGASDMSGRSLNSMKPKSDSLDAALADYRSRFTDIGYGVRTVTTANHDATLSLSLDSPFERLRNNEMLDTKRVVGAAVGVTDGRYYTTFFFTEKVTSQAVQVSGVYVGSHAFEFSVRDQDGAGWSHRFITSGMSANQEVGNFPLPIRDLLLSQPPLTASLWVSEGWLLTETEAETVTIEQATKQWEFLNSVIDAAEELDIPALVDEPDCAPLEAARKLFPEL